MLVQIFHEKPYGKRFDVFAGGKKLKSGEEYDLPADSLELTFLERNVVLSKFWFLLIFFNFIAGILTASFEDFRDERRSRTEIRVRLLNIQNDEILIRFTQAGNAYSVEGARVEVISETETALPQVEKRIRCYKIGIVVLSLAVLAAIIAALCLTLL